MSGNNVKKEIQLSQSVQSTSINSKTQQTLAARTIYNVNQEGHLEECDIETGEVLRVHANLREATTAQANYVSMEIEDGKTILISDQVNADNYLKSKSPPFSWAFVDIICQKLREDGRITEICKLPGMPTYNTLCMWKRKHKGVAEALEQARIDRGEVFHDKVMQTAEQDPDSMTDATHMKTRIEAFKWGAEKGDNQRYGNKTKLEVEAQVATIIMVETGVRKRPPNAVVDETAKLREAKEINEAKDDGK